MGCTAELSDFQHNMIIDSHLSSKLVWEISTVLKTDRSAVSDAIVKWNRKGQQQHSQEQDRSHKMTDWERRAEEGMCNKTT